MSGSFLRNLVGGEKTFEKPYIRYYRRFETYTRYSHIGVQRTLILHVRVLIFWLAWLDLSGTLLFGVPSYVQF